MVLNSKNCVICGKLYYLSVPPLKGTNRSSADVFSAWKSECATALCHVLFGKHLDYFVNYFENTHYCSECEQLVRDASFTWKQVQLFQNRLNELSGNICQMVNINYQLIKDKSEPLVVEKRVSHLLNTTADTFKTANYSFEEMVEVLYSVLSSRLYPDPKIKVVNCSSLSNISKTHQNSTPSNETDTITSSCFGNNNKVKEEFVDCEEDVKIEDEGNYSPYCDEYEDESKIKSDNFDSCNDEHVEPRRINAVESKLLDDVKNDDENSNGSDQNDNLVEKVERGKPRPRLKRKRQLKNVNLKTSKMYYCSEEDCDKRFTSQITRQIHLQKVHRGVSKPYKCTQCLRRFTSSEHMKRHEKNVHEKGRVLKTNSCRFCGSKFIEPDDLTSHCSQFHQPPEPFRCAFCSEVYQNNIDLTKHTKQCHPQTNVCGICEKLFINDSTLNRHHLKNHNDKNPWLQCHICDRKFAMQSLLNIHMEGHNESKLFKCDICGHQFKYSQQLKPHIKTMHEKGQFQCKVCDVTLTTLHDLKTHRLTHQLNGKHKKSKGTANSEARNKFSNACKFCGKVYIKEEDLQTHYATSHQGPKPYACAFCPLVFTNTLILSKHRQTAHPDPHELKGRLKCKSCDLYFANRSSLSFHSKRHIDPTLLLKCHICSAVFRKRRPLDKHLEFHKDESKYACETCGKTCSSESHLYEHSLTHPKGTHRQKPKQRIIIKSDKAIQKKISYDYECKFCSKGYITEEGLNSHYAESHQGPNPFTCAFCSAIYSNSVDLSRHQKSSHPDTNPNVGKLKCKSCDRYFSNKDSLSVHSRIHRDPGSLLKCPLCPASFKHNSHMNLHLESHRNERKYVCDICGKAYNHERTLRNHSITHDESNRKYQCSVCDKKFFKMVHRKVHEITHTNMKEFVCQICGKSFNRDCNLSEHLKIHAGVPTRRRPNRKSRK